MFKFIKDIKIKIGITTKYGAEFQSGLKRRHKKKFEVQDDVKIKVRLTFFFEIVKKSVKNGLNPFIRLPHATLNVKIHGPMAVAFEITLSRAIVRERV